MRPRLPESQLTSRVLEDNVFRDGFFVAEATITDITLSRNPTIPSALEMSGTAIVMNAPVSEEVISLGRSKATSITCSAKR